MFKTLRRLHGHNLENQGLNDISDAFQNFVTRARFFSIGRLRRTWSHSAVEFLKYRRLLPMLACDEKKLDNYKMSGMDTESNVGSLYREDSSSSLVRCRNEGKKVVVTNVSSRVTTNQLLSFFSKFGKVSTCTIPSMEKNYSNFATLPRRKRGVLTAYISFSKVQGAERAKNAAPEELKFYDMIMVVSSYSSSKKRNLSNFKVETTSAIPMKGPSIDEDEVSIAISECSLSENQQPLCSMASLPDNIIQHIFSFVSPIDRIRLERVNKSFLESSVKSWSSITSLSLAKDFNSHRIFGQTSPLRNYHLKAILHRCGVHLECLDLSGIIHLLDDNAFDLISSYCPNLVELNISGVSGRDRALRNLSQSLSKLKSVVYKEMTNATDKNFWNLFSGNGANMSSVDLRGCRRIKGKFFGLFGPSLETLLLDGCSKIENEAIEELCIHSKDIREFSLNGCYRLNDQSLSLITRNMSRLHTVRLGGERFEFLTVEGLQTIVRLDFLTDLSLDYNFAVCDELLQAIIANSQHLKNLSLAYAGSDATLTISSLTCISSLNTLEQLDVSCLAAITSDCITKISNGCTNLRSIICRSCTYLGDDGVRSLGQLKFIEHIDLSGCLLVTTYAIQSLIDSFNINELSNEKNNAKSSIVSLIVGGTICQISMLKNHGNHVVIDSTDYSAISSNTARGLLSSSSGFLDPLVDSESECSGDEIESLYTHRSFIIDALNVEEDDSPMDNEESVLEWAEKEAKNLGLLTDSTGS